MKKNININLAGQLFAIDEDAYSLLLNYTESLRRYYRRQAEGEEVVDDIEARIAELFNELKAQGFNAITIEHVQDIIQRIGRLEDITGGETTESDSRAAGTDTDHLGAAGAAQAAAEGVRDAWNKMRSGKRFYRDAENKMLAGVLAGCSRYFGGDVVIWRAVFLLLMFFPIPFFHSTLSSISGFFFWGYVILAIVAPSASTPEERLKMRGEEVNPQNLATEVNRENAASTANEARAQRRHTITIICAVLLILFSVWMWLGFLGVLCGSGVIIFIPEFIRNSMFNSVSGDQLLAANSVVWSIFYILVAVLVCLFVMAYCSLHTGLNLLDKVKAMSLKERLAWLFVWCVSVICITIAGVNCASKINAYYYDYPKVYEVNSDWEDDKDEADTTATAAPAAPVIDEKDIEIAEKLGKLKGLTKEQKEKLEKLKKLNATKPAATKPAKAEAAPAASEDSAARN